MAQLTVQQALQLLELQPGASLAQIRAAYKRLALQYHPDKQNSKHSFSKNALAASSAAVQQQQQGHAIHNTGGGGSSNMQDPAVRFALLSAAYQQLTSAARSCRQPGSADSTASTKDHPSFEAAYASGTLFTEELLDEALLTGLPPSEVTVIQQLVTAAAAGDLAAALSQQQPTQEDEQNWRKLYDRLLLKWQLQDLQQQQQQQQQSSASSGLLGEMLSDLLLKPIGQVMVEVSDDQDDLDDHDFGNLQQQQQQQQQKVQYDSVSAAASAVSSQSAVDQTCQEPQQHQTVHTCSLVAGYQQDQAIHGSRGSSDTKRRMRHGLGFYWTWLRRFIVAKAVVSILFSGKTRSADYHSSVFAAL